MSRTHKKIFLSQQWTILFFIVTVVLQTTVDASYSSYCSDRVESCSWIRDQDENIIFKVCQDQDTRDQCMISCGICCADNPLYKLTTSTGESQSCSWLAGYRSRKEKYCNDQTAKECARSCDYCMDYVPLTAEPSLGSKAINDSATSYEISTILLVTLLISLFVAGAVVAYFREGENPKVVNLSASMDFVEDIDDHIDVQNSFLEIVVNRTQ